jgi:hypothetical protein
MAVAKRGSTPEEMDFMHKLAKLSEDERRRLIGDFLGSAFGGRAADAEFAGIMRSMTPELPDQTEAGQVEAWLELAELAQDPDFRARLERTAEQHAADRAQGDATGLRRDPVAAVRDQVGPVLVAGIAPASAQANRLVGAVAARYAYFLGRPEMVGQPGKPGPGTRLVYPGPAGPDTGLAGVPTRPGGTFTRRRRRPVAPGAPGPSPARDVRSGGQ